MKFNQAAGYNILSNRCTMYGYVAITECFLQATRMRVSNLYCTWVSKVVVDHTKIAGIEVHTLALSFSSSLSKTEVMSIGFEISAILFPGFVGKPTGQALRPEV